MLCYQLVCIGRGTDIHTSSLNLEENKHLSLQLRSLQKKSLMIIEPVACPQYWPHLLKLDNNRNHRLIKKHPFHGCAAGWGLLYLKSNGDLWPCPFIPVSGGNLRNEPLNKIYFESKIFTDLKDRNKLKGKCSDCPNRYICGGCRGKAFAYAKNYLGEDPDCYI